MITAIKFENISKQYRLGLVSTNTLKHDLNRWWVTSILRKEDPYLKIGEVNDRATKSTSDYVWALKDINFEVQQGDVLGIIGKNGAGKSTLLKILSKVTAPTTGTISARGRIASLLEVGTGFHPEMTGRENVYLNGAILGMTKTEINRKLDEIVDFSGVERYIDTPAKRYSSGMTVRLGFAIAAHLDPEILVVDEVLAVGDAEFQKKAIGKMKDVSKGEGRTVLFVSHNMEAIGNLCTKAISLKDGSVFEEGETATVISNYLHMNNSITSKKVNNFTVSDEHFKVLDFSITQDDSEFGYFTQGLSLYTNFKFRNDSNRDCELVFNIELKTGSAESVTCFGNEFQNKVMYIKANTESTIQLTINELLLKKGQYYASIYFKVLQNQLVYDIYLEDSIKLEVIEPSAMYFINPEKQWRLFPAGYQHGYLNLKVDKFVQIES